MVRRSMLVLVAACGHAASPARPVVVRASPPPPPVARDACASPESELELPATDITTIDPTGVVHAIDGHRGELRRCFERYLKHDPHSGSVTATFTVRDDGTVAQVQVRGFATSLDRCLCNVVARVQFPPPHATAIVSYPMHFSAAM